MMNLGAPEIARWIVQKLRLAAKAAEMDFLARMQDPVRRIRLRRHPADGIDGVGADGGLRKNRGAHDVLLFGSMGAIYPLMVYASSTHMGYTPEAGTSAGEGIGMLAGAGRGRTNVADNRSRPEGQAFGRRRRDHVKTRA